jgi:hypothetical protein
LAVGIDEINYGPGGSASEDSASEADSEIPNL